MHLSNENALKLATALLFSHMEYCNSMFVGLPKETLINDFKISRQKSFWVDQSFQVLRMP